MQSRTIVRSLAGAALLQALTLTSVSVDPMTVPSVREDHGKGRHCRRPASCGRPGVARHEEDKWVLNPA